MSYEGCARKTYWHNLVIQGVLFFYLAGVSVAQAQKNYSVSDCDVYGADKIDEERVMKGVEFRRLDYEAAIAACNEAVETYPDSDRFKYQLARAYLKRALVTGREDYAMTINLLNELANKSYAAALITLGNMHYSGTGMERNTKKAFQLYSAAADLGNPSAMMRAGDLLFRGIGTERDVETGFQLLLRAARLGRGEAWGIIGTIARQTGHEKQAIEWLTKAAETGDSYAMLNLYLLYYQEGPEQDISKAITWLKKASDLGNRMAMSYLANAYEKGMGLEKDEKKAADLRTQVDAQSGRRQK